MEPISDTAWITKDLRLDSSMTYGKLLKKERKKKKEKGKGKEKRKQCRDEMT